MGIGTSHFDRKTLIYGFAHFGKSLFWYTGELFFSYYLSEIADILPQYMGIVLSLGYIFGGVSDLIFGFVFPQFFINAAQTSKVQFWGAISSSITFLLFLAGAMIPQEYRLFYVLITALLFRFSYTIYDIPQNSMMSVGTSKNEHRSKLAAVRIFFSGFATLVVATSAIPLINNSGGIFAPIKYLILAFAWAIIGIFSSFMLKNMKWQNQPEAISKPINENFSVNIMKPILPLIIIAIIAAIFFPIFGKAELYYVSYVLKSATWGGIIMITSSFGIAVSQPIWSKIAHKISRQALFVLSCMCILLPVLIFGVYGLNIIIAIVTAFVFGIGSGGFGLATWAAYGDIVRSNHGKAYSIISIASKIGAAIGVFVFGTFI